MRSGATRARQPDARRRTGELHGEHDQGRRLRVLRCRRRQLRRELRASTAAAPAVSSTTPAAGATGVDPAAAVTATFSEAMSASTVNASTFELRTSTNATVSASVSYDSSHAHGDAQAACCPGGKRHLHRDRARREHRSARQGRCRQCVGGELQLELHHGVRIRRAELPMRGVAELPRFRSIRKWPIPTPSSSASSSASTSTASSPASGSTRAPATPAPISAASGPPRGLASRPRPSAAESASGWQQVNFATPVAVTAGTVYVASYFAPNGNYAGDNGFFASAGVDNGPVHLLSERRQRRQRRLPLWLVERLPERRPTTRTNYWVDVVFTTAGGSGDTTPPTVTGNAPAQGATGVAANSTVTATFSEPMDASTVNATTVELRNAANALVTATVPTTRPRARRR